MEKLPSPIALPKMKSLGVRLCVGGLMVVRAGFVVGETRGAKVLGGATTPLVTSFVGGDILDTGPSTVTAGCGETVSAWFATRCNTQKRQTTSLLGCPRNFISQNFFFRRDNLRTCGFPLGKHIGSNFVSRKKSFAFYVRQSNERNVITVAIITGW